MAGIKILYRVIFTPLLCIIIIATCGAQPQWLMQTLKEAETLQTHEQASEIILYNSTDVEISSNGTADIHIRMMTKILKQAEQSNSILRELKTAERNIEGVSGWLVSPDGNIQRLSDNDIAEVGKGELEAYYDEGQTFIARFPYTAPGDIVAFEYDIEDKEWFAVHQRYSFQIQQPVHYARFSIEVPDGWSILANGWDIDSVSYQRNGNKYEWIARDLPFRPEEPLMPSWRFMERVLDVVAYNPLEKTKPQFSNWKDVALWIQRMHDPLVTISDTIRAEALKLVAETTTTAEKIKLIAEFVRDNIRYVAVEIGKGRWEPHTPGSTLHSRFGDCKDKTTLMRSMLMSIGIKSFVVLLNTSHYINKNIPTPFQFNHAIIAIPTDALDSTRTIQGAISGPWLYFDPTDETIPFGSLPAGLQGKRALVAADVDSVLTRLPYDDPMSNYSISKIKISVKENFSLRADVRITNLGIISHYRRHFYKKSSREDQLSLLREYLSSIFGHYSIADYTTGENNDSVWSIFTLDIPNAVKKSGNTLFVKLNPFAQKDFPALTKPERLYPIWLGGPHCTDNDVEITIPAGWKFEEIPQLKDVSCDSIVKFSCNITASKEKLHYTSRVQNTGELLDTGLYNNVKNYGRNIRSIAELMLRIQPKQ